MNESNRTVQVLIRGRVQAVWFRAWTRKRARELGLDGWVRNVPGGAVEAVFRGPETRVDQMIAACRLGPPMAEVMSVEVVAAPRPPGPGFQVR